MTDFIQPPSRVDSASPRSCYWDRPFPEDSIHATAATSHSFHGVFYSSLQYDSLGIYKSLERIVYTMASTGIIKLALSFLHRGRTHF